VHRYLARTARVAGIGHPIGPHALRRTVGTVRLNQGIPLRDIRHLLRHIRPETTLASYDIRGDALERHASHQVAGFLAGWGRLPRRRDALSGAQMPSRQLHRPRVRTDPAVGQGLVGPWLPSYVPPHAGSPGGLSVVCGGGSPLYLRRDRRR
jgi:hypothetical protein